MPIMTTTTNSTTIFIRADNHNTPKLNHGGVSLKGPLVLPADLFLFFRGEIIHDTEDLPDLLWSLALHHIRHCLARQIKKTLDIQIVCCLKRRRKRKGDATKIQQKKTDFSPRQDKRK